MLSMGLLLYSIIYYYYILYTILFSSSDLLFPITFLPSSYNPFFLYTHLPSIPLIISSSSFILYLSILIYTYLYYILFFSSPLPPHPNTPPHSSSNPSFPSHNLLFLLSNIPPISFILYLSILIYAYLYLIRIFIFPFHLPLNNLTPHILSEGCLEWCSFICVVFHVLSW
jgi:hypothetical protein